MTKSIICCSENDDVCGKPVELDDELDDGLDDELDDELDELVLFKVGKWLELLLLLFFLLFLHVIFFGGGNSCEISESLPEYSQEEDSLLLWVVCFLLRVFRSFD